MTEEDEAFSEIERRSVAKKDAVKAQLDKPQRTWVGLTEEDLKPICDEYRILFGSWVEDFALAIEAKLKEKNT